MRGQSSLLESLLRALYSLQGASRIGYVWDVGKAEHILYVCGFAAFQKYCLWFRNVGPVISESGVIEILRISLFRLFTFLDALNLFFRIICLEVTITRKPKCGETSLAPRTSTMPCRFFTVYETVAGAKHVVSFSGLPKHLQPTCSHGPLHISAHSD